MVESHVKELAERVQRLENEIKLLNDDKKNLYLEYKDRVDIKTFKAAWIILKKLDTINESELDDILEIMKNLE